MAHKHNIVVVGNGLFGSIAATLARSRGHAVTVVSNEEPTAGSLASGCVLAPSWLAHMSKPDILDAMSVLHELYPVHDLEFRTNLLKKFKAQRVDPADVLVKPTVVGKVVSVQGGKVLLEDGTRLPQAKVLVAAGVWTPSVVGDGMPIMRGFWGASLRIKAQIEQPSIHVYAPYRQAVAFNIDKRHVWMGDGTALIAKTWVAESRERVQLTQSRARNLFGLKEMDVPGSYKAQVGVRPYVEGHKSGYFERAGPNVWVSTGGAKNGTVLAALQALRFMEAIK